MPYDTDDLAAPVVYGLGIRSGDQWPTHRHRARKRRHNRARRPRANRGGAE